MPLVGCELPAEVHWQSPAVPAGGFSPTCVVALTPAGRALQPGELRVIGPPERCDGPPSYACIGEITVYCDPDTGEIFGGDAFCEAL